MTSSSLKLYLLLGLAGVVVFIPVMATQVIKSGNPSPLLTSNLNSRQDSLVVTPTVSDYDDLIKSAKDIFSQAVRLTNNDPSASIERVNQALDIISQAIRLDPDRPQAYFTAGWIYESIMSTYPAAKNQALTAYQKAYQRQPSNPTYLNALAYFLLKTQQVTQVAALLDQGLAATPDNPAGQVILAKAYTQLGRIGPALAILTSLSPANFDPDQYQEIRRQIRLLQKLAALEPESANQTTRLDVTVSPSPVREPELDLSPLPTKQAQTNQLVIAAPGEPEVDSILTLQSSNALSGQVTFPADQLELTVKHPLVSAGTKIVTAVDGDINQTIFVKSKTNGSFTLAATGPLDKEVIVMYWIIN